MATSIPVETKDIYSCPICLEGLKSPKSLPCLHTFCKKCICEFIVATAQKQKKKITSYPCPVCKTEVTPTNQDTKVSEWASLLQDNVVISSHWNTLEVKEKTEIQCDICRRRRKSTKGSFWCRDCYEAFCDNCYEFHSLITALANHRVTSLDIGNKYGIDVTTISISCPVHTSKLLEAYCFDHKKLCCLLCVIQNHIKCKNVKAIEDAEFTDEKCSTDLTTALTSLQQTIENLIRHRNERLELLDESGKTSQAEASKVVACAKDKLDCLLIAFTKELTLLQDNEKFAIDEELVRLNKLLQDTCHLVGVLNVVNDEGNAIQKFIQSEKTKSRIENDIFPILNDMFSRTEKVSLKLHVDSILQKVDSMADIGKLDVFKSPDPESEGIITAKTNFAILVKCLELKVNITATLTKVLTFAGKTFACGVSHSEQTVICGNENNSHVIAIDIVSGSEKHVHKWYYARRLAFDDRTGRIFITFKNGHFEQITYEGEFKQINKFRNKLLGGIAIVEDEVYVIVENEIRKFKIGTAVSNTSQMTFCFNVNTECSDSELNGLAIDSKRKHIIYTSKDNKVICTNLEGGEFFQFQDLKVMNKPTSVIVHSSGYILVGNEGGSVHAISPDGMMHFTVIEKCQKITKLCDIWLDQLEQTLFLCGNEFIEIYHID